MDLEILTALTSSFYEAALEPDRWPGIAVATARALDVESCVLQVRHGDSKVASLLAHTANFSAGAMAAYGEHFFAKDLWAIEGLKAGLGQIIIGSHHIPDRELLRSEFYADWLVPSDIQDCIGGSIGLESGGFAVVGLHRARRMRPFTQQDIGAVRSIQRHFRAAVDLASRLAPIRVGGSLLLEAMDRLGAGVILIDGTARIVHANRVAEAVLRSADGLRVRAGKVGAADPAVDRKIAKAIRDVIVSRGQMRAPIFVPRKCGRLYSLLLSQLPADVDGRALGMIFIGGSPPSSLSHWRRALRVSFGLTPAEALLAEALLAGETVQGYCERAGIRTATGRTQLRGILAKAGCNRQIDFIRLVLTDPVLRMIGSPD